VENILSGIGNCWQQVRSRCLHGEDIGSLSWHKKYRSLGNLQKRRRLWHEI